MRNCTGSRRRALVEKVDLEAAGIRVGELLGGEIRVVVHRSRDGVWEIVDDRDLASVEAPLRQEALNLAVTVANGIDAVGRSVTACLIEDGAVSWRGTWRARPMGQALCRRQRGRRLR